MAKRKSPKRRRSLRGLRGLRGIGMLKTEMGRAVLSPVVAGVLTVGTTLGIRAFVKPTTGTASEMIYRHAPLIGLGAGLLGAVGLYYMAGKESAAAAAAVATLLGGGIVANERVVASGGASALAASGLLASSVAPPASAPAATAGLRQLGAVVPEYARMDGIVMEKVNGLNGLGANQQNFGENVSLSGTVNQSAFGTAPFGGN